MHIYSAYGSCVATFYSNLQDTNFYQQTAWVVNSYTSELQTVVNEPIYNSNSYFILYITH